MSFLLEEFRMADEEFRRLRAEGQTRVTAYLTLAGTAVGVIATLAGIRSIGAVTVERVATVATGLMALLGTNTFVGLVVRDIGTDVCARATGRIRNFFITRYPEVTPHITFQHTDAPTRWITHPQSINRRQVAVMTAAFWGASAGLLGQFIPHFPAFPRVIAGAVVAVAAWSAHWYWARARLRRAARDAARHQQFH